MLKHINFFFMMLLTVILFMINILSAFTTATLIYMSKLDVAITVMILTLMIDVITDDDTSLTLVIAYIIAFTFFTALHYNNIIYKTINLLTRINMYY